LVEEDFNGCLGRNAGVRYSVMEVRSSLLGVAPKFKRESGVVKHHACHIVDRSINTFSFAVLLGVVGSGGYQADAPVAKDGLETFRYEFAAVVTTKVFRVSAMVVVDNVEPCLQSLGYVCLSVYG
jgi:hypothetical protein